MTGAFAEPPSLVDNARWRSVSSAEMLETLTAARSEEISFGEIVTAMALKSQSSVRHSALVDNEEETRLLTL